MSRTFADSIDADLSAAFLSANEFAVSVAFARADGAAKATVTAVASSEEGVRSAEATGEIVGYTRHVTARFAGSYSPEIQDVVTIDGASYSVTAIERQFGNARKVTLYRAIATEVTRQNYRRPH